MRCSHSPITGVGTCGRQCWKCLRNEQLTDRRSRSVRGARSGPSASSSVSGRISSTASGAGSAHASAAGSGLGLKGNRVSLPTVEAELRDITAEPKARDAHSPGFGRRGVQRGQVRASQRSTGAPTPSTRSSSSTPGSLQALRQRPTPTAFSSFGHAPIRPCSPSRSTGSPTW